MDKSLEQSFLLQLEIESEVRVIPEGLVDISDVVEKEKRFLGVVRDNCSSKVLDRASSSIESEGVQVTLVDT